MNQKILPQGGFSVSAEDFEYHPLNGDPQTKKSSCEEDFQVSAEEFESSTNGLKGHCSAIELRAHQLSGLHSIT
jgi:hypothetical protein